MAFRAFIKKIGIIIPFFAIFLMSQNTFAESTYISSYGVYGSHMNTWPDTSCKAYDFEEGFSANQKFTRCAITAFLIETGDVTVTGII